MNVAEKRTQLIMNIINSNLTLEEVKSEIDNLEYEFGDDAFTKTSFQKKSKPWDESYFQTLKMKAMAGAGSKEFILHMAEVKQKLGKDKINIKYRKPIIIVIAIFILIGLFSITLLHSKYIKDSFRKKSISDISFTM